MYGFAFPFLFSRPCFLFRHNYLFLIDKIYIDQSHMSINHLNRADHNKWFNEWVTLHIKCKIIEIDFSSAIVASTSFAYLFFLFGVVWFAFLIEIEIWTVKCHLSSVWPTVKMFYWALQMFEDHTNPRIRQWLNIISLCIGQIDGFLIENAQIEMTTNLMTSSVNLVCKHTLTFAHSFRTHIHICIKFN